MYSSLPLAGYHLGILFCVVIIFFSGCTRQHERAIARRYHAVRSKCCIAHNILVESQCLTISQTCALFQGRGRLLLKKWCPIIPIKMTITNNRANPILFDPNSITLKLVDWSIVACRLRLATCCRVLSTTALCILVTAGSFLGAAYITIIGATLSMPLLIKAGYGALAFSGLMISTTPFMGYHQAKKCSQVNEALKHELQTNTPITPITIQPNSSKTVLMFVYKHQLTHQFSFILSESTIADPFEFEVNLE